MNTKEMNARLQVYFSPPSCALLTNVANATGGNARRYSDGLAMSLWPSRGLELHGIEVKVSRSDWVKELENPAKAEAVCCFCDRWWLAVSDPAIIKNGELPPTWGLLVPHKDTLRPMVAAPKLEAKPVSRGFLAAIFRRAYEQSADEAEKAKIKSAAFEEGYKAGREANRESKQLQELQDKVRAFEEASGLHIQYGWESPRKIGEAVKRVLSEQTPLDSLVKVRNWISNEIEVMDQWISEIKKDLPCTIQPH